MLKKKPLVNIYMTTEKIIAYKITTTKIFYECPFCFTNKTTGKHYSTNQFKNGRVAQNRFPTIHHHGNETQKLDNFTTSRSSHCSFVKGEIDLIIDDSTKREELIVYF